MSMHREAFATGSVLPLILLLALPWNVAAQTAPEPASSVATPPMSMIAMDHGDMANMPMPVAHAAKPSTAESKDQSAKGKSTAHAPSRGATHGMDRGAMHGMPAGTTMVGTHDGSMHHMDHSSHALDAMVGMSMNSMQGGRAPQDARSPDYSDGVGYGAVQAHMGGNDVIGKLLIDQLEAFDGRDGHGQSWELEGWYGTDANKLWLRSEGERSAGKLQDGDVEAFWSHAIAAYWDSQLGVRHDIGAGPGRTWAAFGVQGLAPYWFQLEATAYAGSSGRTAARLRVDYDVLFTQHLILTPELEANFYGKRDPARGIGSGLSDVRFGLRLRYEIRREFAPYVGINWVRRLGQTADYARAAGEHTLDRQIVAGIRVWF